MNDEFVIELAGRCQRVAILAELIRIRMARAEALKDNVRARRSLTLPRENFPAVAGGVFKSPAPGAIKDLPSESNRAAGDRLGLVGDGRAAEVEELMARRRPTAVEHNRFSKGRW